jgi:prepilin-type N-terminal cleavage/methylation domain-containing protein
MDRVGPVSRWTDFEGAAVNSRRTTRGGFTLIELLVAISLMVILVGSIVMIFNSSVQTVKISEARIRIQNSGRAALEHLARDVTSMLPMEGGSQRFWINDDGENSDVNSAERHYVGARDSIGFRAVTHVNGTLQPVRVMYRLVYDVDPSRRTSVPKVINNKLVAGQTLYVLRKEVLNLDGTFMKDSLGRDLQPIELCYYVTSFNLEYLASISNSAIGQQVAGSFSQIAPDAQGSVLGPFPGPRSTQLRPDNLAPIPGTVTLVNPMGEPDAASPMDKDVNTRNDVPPPGVADPLVTPGSPAPTRYYPRYIVLAIRVTMRVVEDVEARQERVYSRVIWLPTG